MKRLLAAWMLLVQLALCWTIGLAEDAFEKERTTYTMTR